MTIDPAEARSARCVLENKIFNLITEYESTYEPLRVTKIYVGEVKVARVGETNGHRDVWVEVTL